ncbi:MAG: shikimate dehydrogenase [Candidatus Bathyarchaeia archaeon]
MRITGKTKLCCLIGSPVEHSLSPVMHNAAFKALSLDYAYVAFNVSKTRLKNAIHGIKALGIHGVNVTTPHKTSIIKFLEKFDESASEVKAVNTILNVNSRLIGYNTDGIGAIEALKKNGVSLKDKKVVLLGAGGAARAISFSLINNECKLVVFNRTFSRAKKLVEELRKKGKSVEISCYRLSDKNLKEELSDANVLINATSIGMRPRENESLVKKELLKPSLYVFDIVYDPLETKLLKDAKSIGAHAINGLEMLVYQGAASFKIWTGKDAPIEVMKDAIRSKLLER